MQGNVIRVTQVKVVPSLISHNLLAVSGQESLAEWLEVNGAREMDFYFVVGRQEASGCGFTVAEDCPDTSSECLMYFLTRISEGSDLELAIAFPSD